VLKAYADEHVVSAVVQALGRRGRDVVTVQEHQGEGTDDAEVLAEAMRAGRVVLTNDTDFLALAARCASHGDYESMRSRVYFL
jgi:predicted nuclease of predicted toxin-antitoxin system